MGVCVCVSLRKKHNFGYIFFKTYHLYTIFIITSLIHIYFNYVCVYRDSPELPTGISSAGTVAVLLLLLLLYLFLLTSKIFFIYSLIHIHFALLY